MTTQETQIQGILASYLGTVKGRQTSTPHLDQDTLAAFAEGALNEPAARPVVSHLVDCSFCRHITAELIRLEFELAEEPAMARIAEDQAKPAKISDVLSRLLSNMFGSSENAVFAHHDEEEATEDEKDEEKGE